MIFYCETTAVIIPSGSLKGWFIQRNWTIFFHILSKTLCSEDKNDFSLASMTISSDKTNTHPLVHFVQDWWTEELPVLAFSVLR